MIVLMTRSFRRSCLKFMLVCCLSTLAVNVSAESCTSGETGNFVGELTNSGQGVPFVQGPLRIVQVALFGTYSLPSFPTTLFPGITFTPPAYDEGLLAGIVCNNIGNFVGELTHASPRVPFVPGPLEIISMVEFLPCGEGVNQVPCGEGVNQVPCGEGVNQVPEPSTLLLFGIGVLLLVKKRG